MRMPLKLLVVLGLMLMAGRAWSDTVDVDVDSDFFITRSAVPGQGTDSTTIHVGDTVRWTWRDGFHDVTSDTNVFGSDTTSMVGATFLYTFNTPGSYPYFCTIHGFPGGGMSVTIVVRTKVAGVLTLEDCASAAFPLTFTLHPADNSGDIVRTVTPAANGTFTLTNLPAKNYTVRVKGPRWLAVSGTANTTGGNVSGLNLGTLRGGDANDDNSVDVLDLDQLIQTFDLCEGMSGFNAGADFNCDGCTDVLDLDIMFRNFDQVGD